MTLEKLMVAVKKEMPDADGEIICRAVNELEHRIREEIFIPAGIVCRKDLLDFKKDHSTALILGDEQTALYISYVCASISLLESDVQKYNDFSASFNQRFMELAVEYRRRYLPKKTTPIRGGI